MSARRLEGVTKILTKESEFGGEGVTNHTHFANIIYRWPLTHAQAIKFDLCPVFSHPTPFSFFFSTFPPRVEMYKQEVQLQSAEPARLPGQRFVRLD